MFTVSSVRLSDPLFLTDVDHRSFLEKFACEQWFSKEMKDFVERDKLKPLEKDFDFEELAALLSSVTFTATNESIDVHPGFTVSGFSI
jgi:mannosyltransferase OCH1-like enzyme